jgi:O-antigen/teichoic acid export membrane protein
MLLNTQAVRGLRLVKTFAFMHIIPNGANIIILIVLTLVWTDKGIPVYALLGGFAMAGIVGWMIMEYSFKKKMQPIDFIQSMSCRQIISLSLPMFMATTMTIIIGQTGVIILGIFKSATEVGYYSIAVRLSTLTAFVLAAINSIAAPKFSELYYLNKIDELFYVARKSAKLIFWITTPILIGFVFLGKLLLNFLYGPAFAVAYPALVILVCGQFVNSISGSTGIFMNMTGNQNSFRNIVVFAALINIVVNLLLIPRIGIYGAAISAMMSVTTWNLATLYYIKSKYGKSIGYLPLLRK